MTIQDINEFEVIVLDPKHGRNSSEVAQDIVSYIYDTYRQIRDQRSSLEQTWLLSWAAYLNTAEAEAYIRQHITRVIGQVKSQWRHKINTGKTYEVIETILAYLMQAFFPNSKWFDLEPAEPNIEMLVKIIKKLLIDKFTDWKFRPQYENWLRQMLITGTSVMALPWSDTTESVRYETLDLFDTFFNNDTESLDDTAFIRRVRQTRADIIQKIETGQYSRGVKPFDIVSLRPLLFSDGTSVEIDLDRTGRRLNRFMGFEVQDFAMTDRISTYEFWGDIHLPYMTIKNVVANIAGPHLLRFQKNNYGEGNKPFVKCDFITVIKQAYGMSAIQASSGMIHQINSVVNQMLDGIELSVNPMWTHEPDSGLDPETFYAEPGKVLAVTRHDSVRPMPPPLNNFNLSFQEVGFLEQLINQNTGVGPLIGTAQPRGGERVTAAEINAVLEAGGNRLLNVYAHIQINGLLPILAKTLSNIRKFTKVDTNVRFEDSASGITMFVDIGPPELRSKFSIRPRGVEHVVEKEERVSRMFNIMTTVLQLPPELQQRVDLVRLLEDVIKLSLYEDPDIYIKPAQPVQQGPAQLEPPSSGLTPVQERTILQNQAADGGQQLFQQVFGQQLPPEAAALLAQGVPTNAG